MTGNLMAQKLSDSNPMTMIIIDRIKTCSTMSYSNYEHKNMYNIYITNNY